jgi:hypothetical protein
MTYYYDAVLGLIPLALFGTIGVVSLAGLSITAGVLLGSTFAIGIIGHAMFVNGPVDEIGVESETTTAPTGTSPGD